MARIEPGVGSIPVTGSDNFSIITDLSVQGKVKNPSGSLVLSSSNGSVVISGTVYVRGGGDVNIDGNVVVAGNVTFVSSSNLTVYDPLIVLAVSQSGAPQYDSGLVIERGTGENRAFIWREQDFRFAAITTDETGSTAGTVPIKGYAPLKVLSLVVHSGSIVADTTHLILSSSAGSLVTVSGGLNAPTQLNIHVDGANTARFGGQAFRTLSGISIITGKDIYSDSQHLILSSTAGSVVAISGVLRFPTSAVHISAIDSQLILSGNGPGANDLTVVVSGGFAVLAANGNYVPLNIRTNPGPSGANSRFASIGTAGTEFFGVYSAEPRVRATSDIAIVNVGSKLYNTVDHLILSSSAGSTVAVSGALVVAGPLLIPGSASTDVKLVGSTNTLVATTVAGGNISIRASNFQDTGNLISLQSAGGTTVMKMVNTGRVQWANASNNYDGTGTELILENQRAYSSLYPDARTGSLGLSSSLDGISAGITGLKGHFILSSSDGSLVYISGALSASGPISIATGQYLGIKGSTVTNGVRLNSAFAAFGAGPGLYLTQDDGAGTGVYSVAQNFRGFNFGAGDTDFDLGSLTTFSNPGGLKMGLGKVIKWFGPAGTGGGAIQVNNTTGELLIGRNDSGSLYISGSGARNEIMAKNSHLILSSAQGQITISGTLQIDGNNSINAGSAANLNIGRVSINDNNNPSLYFTSRGTFGLSDSSTIFWTNQVSAAVGTNAITKIRQLNTGSIAFSGSNAAGGFTLSSESGYLIMSASVAMSGVLYLSGATTNPSAGTRVAVLAIGKEFGSETHSANRLGWGVAVGGGGTSNGDATLAANNLVYVVAGGQQWIHRDSGILHLNTTTPSTAKMVLSASGGHIRISGTLGLNKFSSGTLPAGSDEMSGSMVWVDDLKFAAIYGAEGWTRIVTGSF